MRCAVCENDTIKGSLVSPLEAVTFTFTQEGKEYHLKNLFKDVSHMVEISPQPLASGQTVDAWYCPQCKKIMTMLDVG